MRALRAGAVGAVAGLLLPLLAAPALAVEDPVTGYWTRTNVGAPVSLPPPTPVPEGGFLVAGEPGGRFAVSAIRAGADAGSVVAGLTLKIADSLGTPEIVVCPTTERWAPQQGGRLEAAPEAECTMPLETVVEGETLLVTLPPLLQGDVVDVLLAPAPGAAFSASFERATAASVVQAPVVPQSGPAPAPVAPVSTGQSTSTGSGSAGEGFSGGVLSVPDVGAVVPAGGPLLAAPAAPAPVAAAPAPQAAPAPAAPITLARRPSAAPVDRTASLLAVVLLALLAALALRLAAQPAAAPRHLGGGGRLSRPDAAAVAPAADVPATASRGVGRFRAPRLRPPVRI